MYRTGRYSGWILTADRWRSFVARSVTSVAGLLAYREPDDAPGLSAMADDALADLLTGKNCRHALIDMLRQSVFRRLAGYEDVSHAERLRHDAAMRRIGNGRSAYGCVASASQKGALKHAG